MPMGYRRHRPDFEAWRTSEGDHLRTGLPRGLLGGFCSRTPRTSPDLHTSFGYMAKNQGPS